MRKNWEPALENNKIDLKLMEIANILVKEKTSSNYGLMSGTLGIALFLYYYSKYSNDSKYRDRANSLITEIINAADNSNHFSLCSGYVGLLWTLNLLNREKMIECEVESLFEDKIFLLCNQMKKVFLKEGYDFMHAGMGFLLFLLEMDFPNKHVNKTINWALEHLSKLAERDNNLIKWSKYSKEGQEYEYNLGLSHGIPSIVRILTIAYVNRTNSTIDLKGLITGCISYLLSLKQDPIKFGSYFPYTISSSQKNKMSRLAWCYGDLGIALSVWHSAKVLRIKNYEEEALSILKYSIGRIQPANSLILDAGICHGSSGVAHIYNRFFHYTNDPKFKNITSYWIDNVLTSDTFRDGLAGYKFYFPIDLERKIYDYVISNNMLEGIAGIGLALIASVADFEPTWDRCLLIS